MLKKVRIMWLLLVFTSLVVANAENTKLFFPMHSIKFRLPIPNDNISYPLINLPALPLNHISNPLPLPSTYSFTGSKYLQTLNSTSSLHFAKVFYSKLASPGALEDFAGWIEVQDENQGYNRTQITVEWLRKAGCEKMREQLCFWDDVKYTLPENYPKVKIGEIGPKFLKKMCPDYKVTYTLLNHTNSFGITIDTLYSLQPLDREFNPSSMSTGGQSRSYRIIGVRCSVVSPSGDTKYISKNLKLNLLDVNDSPPRHQSNESVIVIGAKSEEELNKSLSEIDKLFLDRDSVAVNNYSIYLLGDDLHLFSVSPGSWFSGREEGHDSVFHFKMFATPEARIPDEGYEVKLVVNDTSMEKGFGDSTANLTLQFPPSKLIAPQPMAGNQHKNILYPYSVDMLSSAAMLARVVEPLKGLNVTQCRFYLHEHFGALNVTVRGGIVYVRNVTRLRMLKSPLQLEIKWRNKISKENFTDFVTINLEKEINSSCLNLSENIVQWGHCASQSEKSCEKTCGLGAGSHREFKYRGHTRCKWRLRTEHNLKLTKYYATCTPDRATCPDERCDELEQLHHWLCPQDCAGKVSIPAELNPITSMGIYRGVGDCKCDRYDMCYCINNTAPKMRSTITTTSSSTTIDNNLFPLPSNIANVSRRTDDPILAKASPFPPSCGGSCVLAIGGGVLFLLAVASVIIACWRHRRVQDAARRDRKLAAAATAQHTYTPDSTTDNGIGSGQLLLSFDMERGVYAAPKILPVIDSKWEFPREKLRIEQTLGEGEFGRVLRARALEICNTAGYTTVAVKTLKDGARESELADLMSEYQLLKEVSHPNVIKLLGACTLPGGPVYLIIEFAEHGSLRNYLRRSRHLESDGQIPNSAALMMGENEPASIPTCKITPRDILSFAWQISKGMNYLNDMKLVHRDLAARNVLLATDMVCKISDFGLTRDVYEDDTYLKRTKGRVPVKWMAPESLADHIYNSKSDVWSFGILLWELVTLGASPYPGVAVQNLFHLLRSGYRMEKPENCSAILYKIMRTCWCGDPNERPSFRTLMIKFESMLSDGVDYLDLNPRTVHNRTYFTSLSDTLMTPDDNEETAGYGNLTLMQPDTVNFLSQPENKSKCAEVDKLQVLWKRPESPKSSRCYENEEPAQELHHYESPIKRHKTDRLKTPTNERPQSYIDMAGANENQTLLRSKSKEKISCAEV